MTVASQYLLAAQPAEVERLQLQSRVWEPAGRALLARLPDGVGRKALDVGCGVMGWLRLLSRWVGPSGTVTGSDVDEKMLACARTLVDAEQLLNVTLAKDDLFASRLPQASFDLLHSRFQLAPLGRVAEQMAAYKKLLKPGGWLVVEDPEIGSWRGTPESPALQRLIGLIEEGFLAAGGDINAGRKLPALFEQFGLKPRLNAHVVALEPGHPYLRLPLQFATSLRARLEAQIGEAAFDNLICEADKELSRPGVWGTTFTLIQAFASLD